MIQRARPLASLFLGAALSGLAGAPANAQQEVPDEADFLLWCGSAYHMLAIGSQDDSETQNFLAARTILLENAAEILFEADFPQEGLEGLTEQYDARVVSDFETGGQLPYTADDCLDALDIEGLR